MGSPFWGGMGPRANAGTCSSSASKEDRNFKRGMRPDHGLSACRPSVTSPPPPGHAAATAFAADPFHVTEERTRGRTGIDQRHVPVGANEVQSMLREARAAHGRPPRKDMRSEE